MITSDAPTPMSAPTPSPLMEEGRGGGESSARHARRYAHPLPTLPHRGGGLRCGGGKGGGISRIVELEVSLHDDAWAAACPGAEALAETAARAALAEAAPAGETPLIVGLVLTDDAEQRSLNLRYRGIDASTNVLSFALADNAPPPGAPLLLGDVVLAYERVAREAAEQQKTLAAHLQHLVVHGVLHLLGFDHENDTEAAQMEAREVEILQRLGVPDPYGDTM